MASDYLTRKLRNLRRDPIRLITRKVADVPYSRENWGKLRLDQKGVLDLLTDFVSRRPKGALAPVFGDLWFLYRTVRQRKPHTVLEFGSGCSTLVMAKALSDNAGGYLYSIESSAEWAESTARCIPEPLRSILEIVHCPVTVTGTKNGLRLLKHQGTPDATADFVFLDGPPLHPGEVAIDLLEREDSFPPGFMLVIDKRVENTEFLRKSFKRDYLFKQGRLSSFTLRS